jgi:hypothetical protein
LIELILGRFVLIESWQARAIDRSKGLFAVGTY